MLLTFDTIYMKSIYSSPLRAVTGTRNMKAIMTICVLDNGFFVHVQTHSKEYFSI